MGAIRQSATSNRKALSGENPGISYCMGSIGHILLERRGEGCGNISQNLNAKYLIQPIYATRPKKRGEIREET